MRRGRLAALLAVAAVAACSRRPTGRSAGAAPPAAPVAPAPVPTTDYETGLGRDIYVRYCATCHGDTGAGDGFNAYNLDPHPRDLSDPAIQAKMSDADLADAIVRGGAGVGLSSLMPPWGRTLSARQVDQVVLYVRTLRKTAP